jgi:UDP-glucuronate decarboxylase
MYEETSHEAPLAPDGSHGDDDFARLIATLIRRSNFIVQALTGDPITIYGDGMQTRSFCYVDDLIEGFLRLMGTDKSVAGPINLGNPIEFSMLELAEEVLRATQSRSEIVFKPLPSDDPVQRQPDITLAQRVLHWTPQINLRDGLVPTVEHFRRILRC